MHIFSLADRNYGVHLGVAITSILQHAKDKSKIFFYIMDGGISKADRNKLLRLTNDQIEFIKMDNQLFDSLPLTKNTHFTKHTYYRYLVPILKPEINKALYLDCDLVVKHSLDELWNTNISDSYAAVCEDTWQYPVFEWKKFLGLKDHSFYFNAGVMLLNLEKMRSDNVTNTLFEYTNKMANIIKYLDQDILNIIFENKKVLLDLKWNVQQTAFFDTGSTQYSENEIEYAREHPYIIHFSGATKPWQAGCLNPLWREYYRYLLKSPWRSSYYKIYCVMGKNKLIKIKNKLKYKIKEVISKNIK